MDVGKLAATALPQANSSAAGTTPGLRMEAGFFLSGTAKSADQSGEKPKDVADAVERIRTHVQSLQRNLDFSVDDSTGQVVVQVLDGDSGKVVRQIPSEEILRLAERLDEMRSLLFEASA